MPLSERARLVKKQTRLLSAAVATSIPAQNLELAMVLDNLSLE